MKVGNFQCAMGSLPLLHGHRLVFQVHAFHMSLHLYSMCSFMCILCTFRSYETSNRVFW